LISEQFAPFTEKFKKLGWDPQEFKFLGRPVDGIQFQEDEIVIVEFKTGRSQLSDTQQRVKRLVEQGKVRFEEIRFWRVYLNHGNVVHTIVLPLLITNRSGSTIDST